MYRLVDLLDILSNFKDDNINEEIFYSCIDKLLNIVLLPKWRNDSDLLMKVSLFCSRFISLPIRANDLIAYQIYKLSPEKDKCNQVNHYLSLVHKIYKKKLNKKHIECYCKYAADNGFLNAKLLCFYMMMDDNNIKTNKEDAIEYFKKAINFDANNSAHQTALKMIDVNNINIVHCEDAIKYIKNYGNDSYAETIKLLKSNEVKYIYNSEHKPDIKFIQLKKDADLGDPISMYQYYKYLKAKIEKMREEIEEMREEIEKMREKVEEEKDEKTKEGKKEEIKRKEEVILDKERNIIKYEEYLNYINEIQYNYLKKAAENQNKDAQKYYIYELINNESISKPSDLEKWLIMGDKYNIKNAKKEYMRFLINSDSSSSYGNKIKEQYFTKEANKGNISAMSYCHHSDMKKNDIYNKNSYEYFEEDAKQYEQIFLDYKNDNSKIFVDKNFRHFDNWKRIDEIYQAPLFQGDLINPGFVNQGDIGDCYFIAALSRIAKQYSY